MDRRQALKDKFRLLAGERVARIREALGDDDEVVERELHTLKGEAQLLGFDAIAQVAHTLEKLLDDPEGGRVQEGLQLVERLRELSSDDASAAAAVAEFVRGVDSA